MSYDSYASSRNEHVFWATGLPLDATAVAAGTRLAQIPIPYIPEYGTKFQVIEWGWMNVVPPTATTAFSGKLQSVATATGTPTDIASSTTTGSTLSTYGVQVRSGDLNQVTSSGAAGANKYSAEPSYTEIDVSNNVGLQVMVVTQAATGNCSIAPWVRGRYVD